MEDPKESSYIEISGSNLYGTGKDKDLGTPRHVELQEIAGGKVLANEIVADDKKKDAKNRDQYDNVVQFVLTLIGYAVGLGNVWRFSYLCAKNGGSAFIILYLIMLVVLGIPLFYLELSLGQAVKKGPIKAWYTLSPNLGGIGVSSVIVSSFISVYYNVIIAWVFFYLFNSFHRQLPWGVCFGYYVLGISDGEKLDIIRNISGNNAVELSTCFNTSTEFFWYNDALVASDSISFAESFNWKLFLCLLLAWVAVYLCVFKGIKSSGKVIYFTATFPYLVLICLFFRAVTLPGAGKGLYYLFLPSKGFIYHLISPQVWLEAATQIFFSLGLSIGALVALASYSKPKYNSLTNSIVVCCANSFTSIFASIIVFSIVGFMAQQTNTDPDLVAKGPGLAFVVFTEAILLMPGSPFWAFLFFVMLLTLGLDSQFATVEVIITVFYDIKIVKKIRKEIFVAILCSVFFVVSIPFVLGNGIYLFQLFDQFAATIPLLLVGFFEFIAVGWVCGVNRFFTEYAKPYHKYLLLLWTIMWKWVDPIIMMIIFIASVLLQLISPLTYVVYEDFHESVEDEKPKYPPWAMFVGTLIILSSVLMIPTVFIVRLVAYQSARDEGKEFVLRVYYSGKDALILIRNRFWGRRVDGECLNSPSQVPYQRDLNHDEDPTFIDDQ